MANLSIREARMQLTHIDEILAKTGVVFLTRRKKRIAKVLPVDPLYARPSHRKLRESMPRLQVSSEEIIRTDRDER